MSKKTFGIIITILMIAPLSVFGATLKMEQGYFLDSASTVNDNLYTAGSNVDIAGTISGDLFAVGNNIIVSGPVSGDIASVGGTLNMSGKISGDARIAGGNVVISNLIGGELIAAGGQISVTTSSTVGKDAKIAGGSVNYSGKVNRDLAIKGETVYINGTIGRNLSVDAQEIKFGPAAMVKGDFDYSSPKEMALDNSTAVLGKTNFHKTEMPAQKTSAKRWLFGFTTFAWLLKFMTLSASALIALYFFRTHVKSIAKETVSDFWKEAGKGFLALVVAPIAIILSFITLLGLPLGFIAAFSYIALCIASSIIAVLVFAELSMKYVFKKENYELNWWVVILAVLAYQIISSIPLVGWIFAFVIFIAAFGSVTNYVYKKLIK